MIQIQNQIGLNWDMAQEPLLIAGPCAVESFAQMEACVQQIAETCHLIRGGAFKPRTSKESFQGLGYEGLEILFKIKQRYGVKIITEVLSEKDVNAVAQVADVIQIGTRNMYNYALLKGLSKIQKPIMLKRGLSATVHEWLASAEYLKEPERKGFPVLLCERGIRSFDNVTRNCLDLSIIPLLKSDHFMMVDPSHATGNKDLVPWMAQAAIASGAHGIMVDVHAEPHLAKCDGAQALLPQEWNQLQKKLLKLYQLIHFQTFEPSLENVYPVAQGPLRREIPVENSHLSRVNALIEGDQGTLLEQYFTKN